MRKVFKKPLFWIIVGEFIFLIILYLFGFKITYAPYLENNWEAIGAMGQWAGAIVGILIPLAAIYIQSALDKNRRDIGESNSALLNEFSNFKAEYLEKIKVLASMVDGDGNISIDGGVFDENSREKKKEKALKFINISMLTKTSKVAEHLGISSAEAFELLVEMLRHDQNISCGGQCTEENMDNIVWLKKRGG